MTQRTDFPGGDNRTAGGAADLADRAICVFCASSTVIDPQFMQHAADFGDACARRGYTVVSGGGSISSMGALATAARAAGGRTVGVIPRSLLQYDVADEDADELVVTEDMRERKAEMDRRSDAFVMLPGGIGTLEEFFEAWVGQVLQMHAKPVVVVDPSDYFRPLHDLVNAMIEARFVTLDVAQRVTWVKGPDEALDAIEEQWSFAAAETPDTDHVGVELESD